MAKYTLKVTTDFRSFDRSNRFNNTAEVTAFSRFKIAEFLYRINDFEFLFSAFLN